MDIIQIAAASSDVTFHWYLIFYLAMHTNHGDDVFFPQRLVPPFATGMPSFKRNFFSENWLY
jgi:hypothetical protein